MTYVYIDTTDAGAVIATDTWLLDPPSIRERAKQRIDHKRGIVATGTGTFGLPGRIMDLVDEFDPDATKMPNLDAVAAGAALVLPQVWEGIPEDRRLPSSSVYLVGRSAAADTYVTIELSNSDEFRPTTIHGAHVRPTPPGYHAMPSEVRNLERTAAWLTDQDRPDAAATARQNLATISGPHARPVPANLPPARLIAFAEHTRAKRALVPVASWFQTPFGGHLDVSHLRPDQITTTRVHQFDPHDDANVMFRDHADYYVNDQFINPLTGRHP